MSTHLFRLLLGLAVCHLVGASRSLMLPSYRSNHGIDALHKRQNTTLKSNITKDLYWYGTWDVGDSKNLKLLIDTGSTDLYLNKGVYKPSSSETRFPGNQTFSGSYEGVTRSGFGFETVKGVVHQDVVSSGPYTVKSQVFGVFTSEQFHGVPKGYNPKNSALGEVDGIIGFLSKGFSAFTPQARPWIHSLCYDNIISKCKFALAFGTSGKGQVVLGETARELIDGDLIGTPIYPHYSIYADIVFEGEILFENQSLVMDVGTDNIQAPLGQAKKMFSMLGYPTTSSTSPNPNPPYQNITNLEAFFPCNKPPSFGFAIPAKVNLQPGQTQRVFNVSTDKGIWDVYDHGNNNCTSVLSGTNFLNDPITHTVQWLVGQPFFAGHYVQFASEKNTISVGDLKDPSG